MGPMRAMAQRTWKAGAPLELLELADPVLRTGELKVAVQAIGVNPVDWKMRTSGPLRLAARALGPRPPVVVGVDFAGVVEAVGPGVTGVGPGDRVVGGTDFSRRQRGSYADTVVVRRDQLCRVPDSLDITSVGALPIAGVTAWRAVVELGRVLEVPVAQRRVLVLGASGGVGQLATQVAKMHGAFVAGVCSTKNVALVTELGADVVLDYHLGDPLELARDHGPFQVIVDCVGTYSGAGCRSLLGPQGRHILVAGDGPGAMLELVRAPRRTRSILGRPSGALLEPLVAAMAAGQLTVPLAETLPLTDAEEAHRLSRSGRLTGKLVLLP